MKQNTIVSIFDSLNFVVKGEEVGDGITITWWHPSVPQFVFGVDDQMRLAIFFESQRIDNLQIQFTEENLLAAIKGFNPSIG